MFDAPVDLGDFGAPMLSGSIGTAEIHFDVAPTQALALADKVMYGEKLGQAQTRRHCR